MYNIIILSTTAVLLAGFSASAQNYYNTTPSGAPSSTDVGLTNPAGTTLYIPNSPSRTLGGTAPPPNNDSAITNNINSTTNTTGTAGANVSTGGTGDKNSTGTP